MKGVVPLMSSWDLCEARSGHFVTELDWACLMNCEMLVKDILGNIFVRLWGFALASVISWFPQKGRREKEKEKGDLC